MTKKYNPYVLKDDKPFFPEYNEAYLMKTTLYDIDMAEIGYAVDVNKRYPEEVAKQFLTQKGLI